MLFNSWIFVLCFLPVTLSVYHLCRRYELPAFANLWLGVASLFFYAWWNASYVAILIASTVANFYAAHWIASRSSTRGRRYAAAIAIACNLSLLVYFKYIAFFSSILNSMAGLPWTVEAIVLPLGISFITFQKIAYIADVHGGQRPEPNFINFLLFVCFFPQLIAGPIVHHREVLPQFARPAARRFDWRDLAIGTTLFGIGLFKKTTLADPFASFVNPIFEAASRGTTLTLGEAWLAALGYTFQLYFDFSGYTDMAIGAARMFGIRLPLNFASPYRSLSIIEFWRRWHMTLSRLLRDYVYIPLGGNRLGATRRYVNLMAVMLVGGLWHGAGWTFVLWGGLHGVFLLINHAWRASRQERRRDETSDTVLGVGLAYGLTFGSVVVAWVFFRAPSLDVAIAIIKSMFALNLSGTLGGAWVRTGIVGDIVGSTALLALAWGLAVFAPNSQTLLRRYRPAFDWQGNVTPRTPLDRILLWRPTIGWSLFIAGCIAVSAMHFSNVSEFIYFNF